MCVVMCTLRDVEIVQDAPRELNLGGQYNGGEGGKKRYIYPSSADFLVQGSTCEFCWLTHTKQRISHLAASPGTS